MAVVYATLIVSGMRDYRDVPARLKEKVKEILIGLDLEDLASDSPAE